MAPATSRDQAEAATCVQELVSVAQLDSLPFASDEIQTTFQSALLLKRTHFLNWFHTLTEDTSQIYDRFCRYLGLCAWADFAQVASVLACCPAETAAQQCLTQLAAGQGTALLTTDGFGAAPGNYGEVLACYGENINVLTDAPSPPVLVKRLGVGTGDHCNPAHCYECVPASQQARARACSSC